MKHTLSLKIKPLLIVLAAWISAYGLNLWIPYVHIDEGFWLTLSQEIWSGNLYHNVTDHKPPFLFQWTWISSAGAHSALALQFFKSLLVLAAAFSLCKISNWRTKNTLNNLDRMIVICVFLIFSSLIVYGAYSAERVLLAFVIFSYVFFFNRQWILAGILMGAAAGIKQPAVLFVLPLFAFFPQPLKVGLKALGSALLGFILFSLLSWVLTRSSFSEIWNEAYLTNFTYMSFDSFHSYESSIDVIRNILIGTFLAYGPLILPSLLGIRHAWRLEFREGIFISLLLLVSIVYVSFGQRFLQQYFVVLALVLTMTTAFWLSQIQSKNLKRVFLIICFIWMIPWKAYLVHMELKDKNKNWDSQIHHLLNRIANDTESDDSIWISNHLFSVYFESQRKPAVKYLYFHWVLGHIDICRADKKDLFEHPLDPRYLKNLSDLKNSMPKIIFWTSRSSNACSHRLVLENFPSLHSFIEAHYRLIEKSELGDYYLRIDD